MKSKSEIKNEIARIKNEIAGYEIQIDAVNRDLEALNVAWENIQAKMTEFYDLYPDSYYVISNMLDDVLWKGYKRDEFEYDFPEEYQAGLSSLASDSLDARDWIIVEINNVENKKEKLNKKIKGLNNDLVWMEKQLWLVD